MRIGIDARFYGPDGKGIGRYVQKLLEHLEPLVRDHEVSVFLLRRNWDRYTPKNPAFKKVLADVPWYSVKEQLLLPGIIRRERLDLMHFPHYNVPLLFRGRFVVTIHDLIVSRFPTVRASTRSAPFYWAKHLAYNIVLRRAIGRAAKIFSVTEYSKRVLEEELHMPGEKITVTYEAADPPVPAEGSTYGQEWKPYCLYVGNAYPHKNVDGLLRAFVHVHRRRPELKLVLVGKMDYFFQRTKKLSDELGLSSCVVFPGYVPDDGLASLYRHAALYTFPSHEEGFGLPPLEAMWENVPVLSSDRSCLPEVLGDAAEYVDPDDAPRFADAIIALLGDDARRQELVRKGQQQVRKYSWSTLARMTLDGYTDAAGKPTT